MRVGGLSFHSRRPDAMFKNFFSRPFAASSAFVALAVAAVYARSLGFATFFDDDLLTRADFANDYAHPFVAKVRALSYSSIVMTERLLGGGHVALHRVLNLLLHLGNAAVLFLFYRQFAAALGLPGQSASGQSGAVDMTAAHRNDQLLFWLVALWAINPVAVYAVVYVVQRSILMATLFSLLALLASLRFAVAGRALWLVVATVCYAAAMFSKEYAVALPLAMIGVIVAVRRPAPLRLAALAGVALAVAAVVVWLLYGRYGYLVGKAFDDVSIAYLKQLETQAPGVADRAWGLSILNQASFFFRYLALWLVPNVGAMSIDLRPRFPVSFNEIGLWVAALSFIVLAALGVFLVVFRRGRQALFGWGLVFATSLFLTEFVTVWIQDPFVLYRSYLWSVALPGLLLAAMSGWARLDGRPLAWGGVALFLLFAALSSERIHSMRTPYALWDDAVAKLPTEMTPGQSRPYFNRGMASRDEGRTNAAVRDFLRASRLGDTGEGLFNVATMLAEAGRPAEAMQALSGAMRRGMTGGTVLFNAGSLMLTLGAQDAALDAFSRAIAASPPPLIEAEARARRALLLFARREVGKGQDDVKRAAELAPDSATVLTARGYAALERGEIDQAARHFASGVDKLATAEGLVGLAQAQLRAGQREAALATLDRAIALDAKAAPELQALRARVAGSVASGVKAPAVAK